jgi:hypothetical protein
VDTYYCRATLSNYFKLVHTRGKGEKQERSDLRPIDEIFGFPERGGSRVRTKGVNEKCLLTNPGLDEKPGFYAYQNLCAIWEPGYKPHPVDYKIDVVDQGIFYGIEEDDAFPSVPLLASYRDDQDRWLIAWWLPWTMQEYLPRLARINIELDGVKFKDLVLIDLLSGNLYEPGEINNRAGKVFIKNMVLADYPLLLAERSSIDISTER